MLGAAAVLDSVDAYTGESCELWMRLSPRRTSSGPHVPRAPSPSAASRPRPPPRESDETMGAEPSATMPIDHALDEFVEGASPLNVVVSVRQVAREVDNVVLPPPRRMEPSLSRRASFSAHESDILLALG